MLAELGQVVLILALLVAALQGVLPLLNRDELPDLRRIPCGGSAVPLALSEAYREKIGMPILQAWGMTETSPVATASHIPARDLGRPEEELAELRARVGLPLPGVEIRIVEPGTTNALPWDDETTGELVVLQHSPSGSFSLSLDSFGRVIFTKWDHLQRDQQGDAPSTAATYKAFTWASEDANAAKTTSLIGAEVFPEPRTQNDPAYSPLLATHRFNHFFPWEINQDGTAEETLNHVGRHELGGSYTDGSFRNEVGRAVNAFGVDRWLVSEEAYGPFTSSNLFPVERTDEVTSDPGVEAAEPVLVLRFTVPTPSPTDLNVIGIEPGGIVQPPLSDGRGLENPGEIIVDKSLGVGLGDPVDISGQDFEVVGEAGPELDAVQP